MYVAVAALWRFPIPFGAILGVGPFVVSILLAIFLVLGPKRIRDINSQPFRVSSIQRYLLAAQPDQQTFCFVLLPIIRLAMKKNIVATISPDLEDLVPELALFTAELFNALYMVSCMQNAASTNTTLLAFAFDAATASLSLRSHYRDVSIVDHLVLKELGIRHSDLFTLTQRISHEAELHNKSLLSRVRLRTVSNLRLQRTNSDLMRTIESAATQRSQESTRTPTHSRRGSNGISSAISSLQSFIVKVAPAPEEQVAPRGVSAPTRTDTLSNEQKGALIELTLKLLFRTEFLVLTEYIECTMPLLFAMHLAALAHVPNARFYPYTRVSTSSYIACTLTSIIIYEVRGRVSCDSPRDAASSLPSQYAAPVGLRTGEPTCRGANEAANVGTVYPPVYAAALRRRLHLPSVTVQHSTLG